MRTSLLASWRSCLPACCTLACLLLLAGGLSGQQTAPNTSPADPPVVAQQPGPSEAPDFRLRGDELTLERVEKLAGGDWGNVFLLGKFSADMLESLKRPRSIKELQLVGTGLNGQWGRLREIPFLTALELRETPTVRDLEGLATLTQLRELTFQQKLQFSVTGARQLGQMTGLTTLSLVNSDVDDAALVELKPLVNLRRLDLRNTRVTDAGLLGLLPHLPRLQSLDLSRSPSWYLKQQITDACLPAICKLPELESLSLSGEITAEGLAEVAKIPTLKGLDLIMLTTMSWEGLRGLEGSGIETLSLSTGCLDVPSRQEQENFQQLGIQSHAVQSLQKMKSLKQLHIHGQAVWDMDSTFMKSLPGISIGFGS